MESHTKNKLQHSNSFGGRLLSFGLLFSKSLCTDKNTQSLLFRTQNQQGGPHVILCCDTIKFIPIILQLMTFHSCFCSFFIHKINIQDSPGRLLRVFGCPTHTQLRSLPQAEIFQKTLRKSDISYTKKS